MGQTATMAIDLVSLTCCIFLGSWKNNSQFLGKQLPYPAGVVTTVLRPEEDLLQT
jgi:hypothetical protein